MASTNNDMNTRLVVYEKILAIVMVLFTIAVSINGYFITGWMKSIDTKLAVIQELKESNIAQKYRIDNLEREIEDLKKDSEHDSRSTGNPVISTMYFVKPNELQFAPKKKKI